MENNILSDFVDYIELLCTQHVEIRHSEDKPHFIELNSDKQLSKSKLQRYPLVTIDKLSVSYPGQEDATRKNRMVEMLFLDKVSDAGNYKGIQQIKESMERVAEDFIKKIKLDKKARSYPFLKRLTLDDIELNFAENEDIGLYGVLLSFSFELPFVDQLEDGRFVV